jgi:hypothetical protein
MKQRALLAVAIAAIFAGCSVDTTKMVPDFLKSSAGHSTNSYTYKHGKVPLNVIRDGVTFTDGSYITPQGESSVILPRGYYFVSSDGGRILAANNRGSILVLKSNGQELSSTKLEAPLVSGVAYSSGIAYLLQGNRFGLYNPFANKVTYQKQFNGGSAIDNRLANPVVTSNYLALPTLDGKLIMINMKTPAEPGVIPVGQNKSYGNIIYLKAINGGLLAVTPSTLLFVSNTLKKAYSAKVADLTLKNGLVYLLTRDGKVQKLSLDLSPVKSREFTYADFATITAFDGKVYAYAKSGSLVVLDDSLEKYKVYSIGAARSYSYVSGRYLYIDKKKVDLSALGYE